MPDWLISAVPSLIGVAVVAGALMHRVSRLESDMDKKVSRELFDVEMRGIRESLLEIKALLSVHRFRVPRDDDTDPG